MKRTIFYFAVAFSTTIALGVTVLLIVMQSPGDGARGKDLPKYRLP